MPEQGYDEVKIYFIEPINDISVIISTLIEIEFEAYSIKKDNKDKLLKLLTTDERSVIFICINNNHEVIYWFDYVKKVKMMNDSKIIIGAFIFDNMNQELRNKFLEEGVATIPYNEIKNNTFITMKHILTFFEAKGKRFNITTNCFGICNIYIKLPNRTEPLIGTILSISVKAFICEFDSIYKNIFTTNTTFNETLLVLNGVRVTTNIEVLGFSKDNPNKIIFKYLSTKIENDKLIVLNKVSPEMKVKIHNYIKWCLKESLKNKIDKIDKIENN